MNRQINRSSAEANAHNKQQIFRYSTTNREVFFSPFNANQLLFMAFFLPHTFIYMDSLPTKTLFSFSVKYEMTGYYLVKPGLLFVPKTEIKFSSKIMARLLNDL